MHQDNNKIVYYSGITGNNTALSIKATIDDTRASPTLDHPGEYYVGIEKFTVPVALIPIFTRPSSGLGSYYSVTMGINGVTPGVNGVMTQVLSIPPYLEDGILSPQFPYNSNSVWTFNQIVQAINTALSTIMTYLNGFGLWGSVSTPNINFNTSTSRFELLLPVNLVYPNKGGTNNANSIWIMVSPTLGRLLDYFPGQKLAFDSPTENIDHGTWIWDIQGNQNWRTVGSTTYNVLTQENDSRWAWNDLQNIVFTSNSLPMRPDLLSSVITYTASLPILTDFTPLLNADFRDSDLFQYYPQGPKRYVELLGEDPLRRIEISVYWTDKYGNIFPLYLPPNSTFSIKLSFVKKNKVFF